MKRTRIILAIGLVITLFYVFCSLQKTLPLERLELLFYDLRFQLRGKVTPPDSIMIVAIDDRSLARVGRWPWERRKLARIVDRLKEMGARVVLLDIICADPAPGDAEFGDAIRRAGNVLLPIVFTFKGGTRIIENENLTKWSFPMIRHMDNLQIFPPISATNVILALDELAAGARGLGHITMIPDRDGVLRWEIMAIEYGGELYPSIDLQAARLFLNLPQEALIVDAARGVQLGDTFIPTDCWHRALIHYYGPANTFPSISAVDLLEKNVDHLLLKDKIVLVGATATGIHDVWVTPASPAMPGVEKHANVIASILQKRFPERTKNITSMLVLLASGIAFSLCMVRARASLGAALAFLFLAGLFIAGYRLYFSRGLWVDLGFSSINLLSIYFVVTAFRFAMEERYARRIRGMFSSYVTQKIVNELIRNPKLARLGGERREITVLFSDVRGFTTFSEEHSPEEVVSILNEYLGEMTQVILSWDGTLDKFIGDEIVAFWGAPLPQADHASRAVRCALEMIEKLQGLQAKRAAEGKTALDCGIGINTGEVLVGNIGAEGKKMEYTVIGDHVNLGARVEGLTRRYDCHLVITEYTLEKLRESICAGTFPGIKVRGLESVAVKGRTKPVVVYEVSATAAGEEATIIECTSREVVHLTEK
jgi:adenylate cyclase